MPWNLEGNGNIDAGDWLGTRNNASLIIRTQNGGESPTAAAEAMRITPAAQGRAVCIGTQTPGAGAKLTVAGGDITWGNNSRLQRDQGGSIELGGDSNTPGTGTPYIDFHFQGLAQDFNTRIINDANAQLTISAGTLRALGNIKVSGEIGFTNATTPMLYIFESGTQNPERPVIAHSPAFPNWGLSYRDVDDTMIFQQAGQPVMSVALQANRVDINGQIFQRGTLIHPDYVFDKNYQVEPIEEHAEFMWREKHLSAVPKAHKDEDGQYVVEYGSLIHGLLEELEKAHVYIERLNETLKKQQDALTAVSSQLQALSTT